MSTKLTHILGKFAHAASHAPDMTQHFSDSVNVADTMRAPAATDDVSLHAASTDNSIFRSGPRGTR